MRLWAHGVFVNERLEQLTVGALDVLKPSKRSLLAQAPGRSP